MTISNTVAEPRSGPPSPLRVAVVGASGIGKNHARWFHQHGCDVAAFCGSSPESVARTQSVLEQGFGFRGTGYHDLSLMLAEVRPDAVCIATPPELHYQHVQPCLAAGAHILCEKPLVYDPSLAPGEMVADAEDLVRAAAARRRLLGTQMQYAAAARQVLEASGQLSGEPVREFAMVMETKNLRPGRDYESIWIDLSPHPLSVLQKLAPGAELVATSIHCTVTEQETDAQFTVRRPEGVLCRARVTVRVNPDAAAPLRRFTIDGASVNYTGRRNAEGQFRSYLTVETGPNAGREVEMPDFVDLLIGNFVAACRGEAPLEVTGADGAQNVDWQLRILAAASRA